MNRLFSLQNLYVCMSSFTALLCDTLIQLFLILVAVAVAATGRTISSTFRRPFGLFQCAQGRI